MKNRLFDRPAVSKVLDDDPLEEIGRHPPVPDAVRIDHDNRSTGAYAEAGRFAALDSTGPEKESFTLQQVREELIETPSLPVGRAKAAGADEDVA